MKRLDAPTPLIADERVLCTLRAAQAAVTTPPGGWLHAGRHARGVSQQKLADALGFKRQAWAQLEGSEAREAISLHSLRRAAAALGYDLVYFLVPRENAAEVPIPASPPPASIPAATVVAAAAARVDEPSWRDTELPMELR